MILKFYNSEAKGLKLQVKKFWGQIRTSEEVAGDTLHILIQMLNP